MDNLEIKKQDAKEVWFFEGDSIKKGSIIGGDVSYTYDALTQTTLKSNSVVFIKSGDQYFHKNVNQIYTNASDVLDLVIPEELRNMSGKEIKYNFSDYQLSILKNKTYGAGQPIYYPALKLNGEAGEIAEKLGKILRDKNGIMTDDDKHGLLLELGDVLWYITALATDLGFNLEDVAIANEKKVAYRNLNNKVHGSGDNR